MKRFLKWSVPPVGLILFWFLCYAMFEPESGMARWVAASLGMALVIICTFLVVIVVGFIIWVYDDKPSNFLDFIYDYITGR